MSRRLDHRRPLVLALDVGTSSCRASLYDADGKRLRGASAAIGYAPTTTADGGAELDPDRLFEHVCATIDAVARRHRLDEVAAVATATFWHSPMGVDADARAATPIYLWMDARSGPDAERLRRTLDERATHARTGCMLHWSYWPAKLLWLARTQPARSRRIHRWLSFGEYLLLRLLGRTAVSVSMASGTGLLDQRRCAWDEEMLAAVALRPEALSPLAPLSTSLVGLRTEFASRWPALRDVPWLPAVGDGAASNVGAGCTTRQRFALMVGTSAAERVVWRTSSFTIPWGTWCYRVDERRPVLGGALNDGGSLFAWLRRSLALPAIERAEAELAAMVPDEHGLTVLPFWGGERSTGWAADARGAIVGLRLHTTPLEILRAALEAVALRFREIDARLREAVPEAESVVATGGALLRSPAWMQIVADALGQPVHASTELEASSRGAALLALEALGQLAAPIEAMKPPTGRVYEPLAAHTARYRAALERQTWLYQRLVADEAAARPPARGWTAAGRASST